MSAPTTILNNEGKPIYGRPKVFTPVQVTVTTAGTRVQLATTNVTANTTNAYSGVYIRALPANSGTNMYVGDVTVDSTHSFIITKNDTNWLFLPVADLSTIYVDAQTSGDKVCYIPV